MVSADGGDVYPVVLVTEVCVTLVALHVCMLLFYGITLT